MIQHNTEFAKLLKQKNITEIDLAKMLDLHKNTVYNYVSRRTKTPKWIIKFVKDYLDILRNNHKTA